MSSNEMRQGKKPTTEINGYFMAINAPTSLLKSNNMIRSSVSRYSMSGSIPNPKSSTMFQNGFETCTLQSINRPATKSQQIFNSSNPMANTKMFRPSGSSILKKQPQKISNQVQLIAHPISSDLKYKKSQKSVELDEKIIVSFPSATPSGTNSTTVNHTNSSLVYLKPVSTIGTAPTKNIIEINNTSDFAKNFLIKQTDSIYSSSIGAAQNSSAASTGFEVSSIIPLLLPAKVSNFNEFVNGTSNNSSNASKTHLKQTFVASNRNPEHDIYRDVVQHEYSNQVNNHRYHMFMYFIFRSGAIFCEINCHHAKFEYCNITLLLFKLFFFLHSQGGSQLQYG